MIKFILILTLFSHLLFLNIVPSGITNDELHFVLNSKSVFLNFSNLANNWNPLSFTTIPHETSSELTFLTLSPIIGPLPLSLFTVRLPLALLSVGVVFLIYLISLKLFTPSLAITAAFVAAINPWIFYVYRTTFDAPIAIFFMLLTFYLLIGKSKKLLATITTIISITFAFYTYIGTKVIIFPFVLLISYFVYYHLNPHHNLKKLVIINLYTFVLSLIFFINLTHSTVGARTSELITPWNPQIIAQVEQLRSQTLNNKYTPLFTNKFTVYSQFVISKWLNSFSPNLLFLKGDDTFTGSLWRHGYFYVTDAILILFGLIYLFLNSRPTFYLFGMLLAISPIPEIIRKDQIPAYVFHSALQYPLLIIIAGIGLGFIFSLIKNKLAKRISIFLYGLLYVNLLFIYFLQYPNYASESFSFSNRLLSNYLISQSSRTDNRILIFAREPDAQFKNYVFYSNSLNRESFKKISTAYSKGTKDNYQIDNLIFLKPDTKVTFLKNDIIVVENGVNAPSAINQELHSIIYRLDNHQPAFNIYGSQLCKDKTATLYTFYNLSVSSATNSICKFIKHEN